MWHSDVQLFFEKDFTSIGVPCSGRLPTSIWDFSANFVSALYVIRGIHDLRCFKLDNPCANETTIGDKPYSSNEIEQTALA